MAHYSFPILKAETAGCCKTSFHTCARNIAGSICGRESIFAQRWGQWMREPAESKYLENQKWEEDGGYFTITMPTEL